MDNNVIKFVENSKIDFCVFRNPVQNAEVIFEPAEELVFYLEKALGQRVPQHQDGYAKRLVLHIDPLAQMELEEFVIEASNHEVVLKSRTCTGMFHAVYYFLEKAVGVRWLWPGTDGEVVPKCDCFEFPIGRISEKPDFLWRALQVRGSIYGPAGGLDLVTTQRVILDLPRSYQHDFDLWCRRNRFGGVDVADGHRWCEIAPPEVYGESEPDIYALINGKRDALPHDGKHGNQPCLSNPRVVELMVEYVCARFATDPCLDVCSIALNDNDGNGACGCAVCRDQVLHRNEISYLDQITDESNKTGRSSGLQSISDLVYRNANEVIAGVRERYPDKKILILLYDAARQPPVHESLDPQVVGQLCIMGNSLWNEEILALEKEVLEGLSSVAPTLGVYEYYSNGVWPELHRLFPELISLSLNMYFEGGVRYFSSQPSMGFAANGLNFYLLGRLLWDRSLSVDGVVDDFCQAGFGQASGVIKNYLMKFSDRWRETKSGTDLPSAPDWRLSLEYLYSEEFLEDRQKDLREAMDVSSGNRAVQGRIEFLEKGLAHTSLYCGALRETRKVYDLLPREAIDGDQDFQPDEVVARLSKVALSRWEDYWRFVKANMGGFVFGEYWVNYRPGIFGRDDVMIKKLKKLSGLA